MGRWENFSPCTSLPTSPYSLRGALWRHSLNILLNLLAVWSQDGLYLDWADSTIFPRFAGLERFYIQQRQPAYPWRHMAGTAPVAVGEGSSQSGLRCTFAWSQPQLFVYFQVSSYKFFASLPDQKPARRAQLRLHFDSQGAVTVKPQLILAWLRSHSGGLSEFYCTRCAYNSLPWWRNVHELGKNCVILNFFRTSLLQSPFR